MKTGKCSASRRGLTLMELLVVVALMGMVMATVSVRLSGALGPAALGQAVTEWRFTDKQLRTRARRSGRPTKLFVEIGTNGLRCSFDADEESSQSVRSLGQGVRLSKCISATQDVTYGPFAIQYDERGTTETFAAEFTGRAGAKRWILVAGITGQSVEISDETAAREILALAAPPRLYAD